MEFCTEIRRSKYWIPREAEMSVPKKLVKSIITYVPFSRIFIEIFSIKWKSPEDLWNWVISFHEFFGLDFSNFLIATIQILPEVQYFDEIIKLAHE